jgi:ABC-type uncharacterized transport system substrate-binding protein
VQSRGITLSFHREMAVFRAPRCHHVARRRIGAQAIPGNAQELRVRTVGVLMGFANDAEAKARVRAFEQGLERVGWSVGQNLRIEYRYAEGDSVRMQALAKELVQLKPDCKRIVHP